MTNNQRTMKTAKNIRYRGAVQPVEEYLAEVEAHEANADREYDGHYRGAGFHHDKGEDAMKHAHNEHEVKVCYRGAKGTVLVG